MNIRTKNRMAIFAATLAITCLALSGCHNDGPQSGITGQASSMALNGVYITPTSSTGHNILLCLDAKGARIYLDGTYDQPNNMIHGTCVKTGMTYTLVGTTVRISGGQETTQSIDYGRSLGYAPGPHDGDTDLMAVTDSGQSLSWTLPSGNVIKFIRQ